MAFVVSPVSQYMHVLYSTNMEVVLHILCCLKSAPGHGILFSFHSHLRVEAYTDADWVGSLDDRRSTTGYCTLLVVTLLHDGARSKSLPSQNFNVPEDLSAYDGLELRLKGDGRRYKIIVRISPDWDTVGYTAGFDTIEGQWQSIRLPFSSLRPIFRARTVPDALPFDPSKIMSLQLMFSKFEYDRKLNPTFAEGEFQLPVSNIRAYIQDPITPRFVHVGSAGVTRPDRPGLDLSKQPPAVRLNKELGFILTFKLKVLYHLCAFYFSLQYWTSNPY
ncbi:uncharacterized protein LOC122094803 [Macadamia integrifolia]|uniref:uncharacterized protein LOC122094803 n=1 Tax=Macadamia integrifolia TaxID=60698 RepID=UPI001C527E17|nr:uncharacterized protein LOC122094803 [Macadamia integrifolia]